MKEAKVLFIAQEITPYLPESEIANICRNLPQGIQDRAVSYTHLTLPTTLGV